MSKEEIINKANLIIENHREIDKMMVIEMVDLVQGLLDLYNKEKELADERYAEIVRLSNETGDLREMLTSQNRNLQISYDSLQELFNLREYKKNSIPILLIEKKIEELSGMVEIGDISREMFNRIEYAIEVLLELLDERNNTDV